MTPMLEYVRNNADHLALILLCVSVLGLSIAVFNASAQLDKIRLIVKKLQQQISQTSKRDEDGKI